jgi:alcohol dehydrogenase
MADGFPVTVCDLSQDRLNVAERMGAVSVTTELEGSYDIIIDAVGAEATHKTSLSRLKAHGVAVWVGNASAVAGFDAREIVRGEHTVLGSFASSQKDFRDAAQLAATLDTSWVQSMPLEDAPQAFEDIAEGRLAAIKVQFTP